MQDAAVGEPFQAGLSFPSFINLSFAHDRVATSLLYPFCEWRKTQMTLTRQRINTSFIAIILYLMIVQAIAQNCNLSRIIYFFEQD